ncbi:MAG: asparagine synthase-related protein, partial [Terriglobales bacterium]
IQAWKGVPRALLRESMAGILPDEIAQRTWKADFTCIINQGLALDFNRLTAFLTAPAASPRAGYVDDTKLQERLAGARNRLQEPYCNLSMELTALAALEMWQRVFLKQVESIPAPETLV